MSFDPAASGWTPRPGTGLAEAIGPLWTRREGEAIVYGIPIDARHLNRGGIVHGGTICTFADIALGVTAHEAVRPRSCATIQLNVHFVAAVQPGEFIEARAELVRATKSLVFVRCACNVGDRVVAMADGVWKILSPGRGANPPDFPAGRGHGEK